MEKGGKCYLKAFKLLQCSRGRTIQSLAIGSNHMLFVDSEGKVTKFAMFAKSKRN